MMKDKQDPIITPEPLSIPPRSMAEMSASIPPDSCLSVPVELVKAASATGSVAASPTAISPSARTDIAVNAPDPDPNRMPPSVKLLVWRSRSASTAAKLSLM